MLLHAKLMLAGAFLIVVSLMGWGMEHYHKLYVKSVAEIAVQTQIKDEALANLKVANENTLALLQQAKQRELQVIADQVVALASAKKHNEFAMDILTVYRDIPSADCPEGNEVINQYLRDVKERESETTIPTTD
jgi:hypothetical protein